MTAILPEDASDEELASTPPWGPEMSEAERGSRTRAVTPLLTGAAVAGLPIVAFAILLLINPRYEIELIRDPLGRILLAAVTLCAVLGGIAVFALQGLAMSLLTTETARRPCGWVVVLTGLLALVLCTLPASLALLLGPAFLKMVQQNLPPP